MDGAFYYVYVLLSLRQPERRYTGWTDDLDERLKAHNAGRCPHTAKFAPWRIETAIAVRSREKAIALERYLKSHSGRAFTKKHF
jgi:predicted GIY-YIG superfamily endonuclease